jgi:GDP-4-dehydro-6-deoxy-D-mannose reductase
MKKILITGFTGFVSGHLLNYLRSTGKQYDIVGLSRTGTAPIVSGSNINIRTVHADLNDRRNISVILEEFKPDHIIHLASDSSVAHSWQTPVESFQNNTNIFLNLVESVRVLKFPCRILSIGSSEEYGVVDKKYIPITEETPFNPVSPYAVARVSQELLSGIYAKGYGVDIVLTRSFNHIGPGQKDNFVISSFARQIIKLKKGKDSLLQVGNIDVIRDFLDVRDVVKAYMLLLEKGKTGEVYNICSGKGYSLKEVLDKMMIIAGVEFDYHIDKQLIRPADNPIIIGSNEKIQKECGWEPEIPIETSLKDILDHWEKEMENEKLTTSKDTIN